MPKPDTQCITCCRAEHLAAAWRNSAPFPYEPYCDGLHTAIMGAVSPWQKHWQAAEAMLVLPACAQEEAMEIAHLPYSDGLVLTQSAPPPERPFQLQEALALLVPGELLLLRLDDTERYDEVRTLVEQLATTAGIVHLECGKVGDREMAVGIPPTSTLANRPAAEEHAPDVMEHTG